MREAPEPSLGMSVQQLRDLTGFYSGQGTRRGHAMAQMVLAYQHAKDAIGSTDPAAVVSAAWHALGQCPGLARDSGIGGLPSFDPSPWMTKLEGALSARLLEMISDIDRKANDAFGAATDPEAKRKVAKETSSRLSKILKGISGGMADLPSAQTDIRICALFWKQSWQNCSKAIAKEKRRGKQQGDGQR